MGNPKIAVVAYCLAVGFILVVAFHSSSKTLVTASVPAVTLSYRQILVTAGPVRRRRLWADGRSAWR
jgi:hypothetical protein